MVVKLLISWSLLDRRSALVQPIILIWLSFQLFFNWFCYALIFYFGLTSVAAGSYDHRAVTSHPIFDTAVHKAAKPKWPHSLLSPLAVGVTLLGFQLKHVGRCAGKTESNYKTRTSDRVWEGSKFSVKWLIHLLFKYLLSRTHFLMLLSSVKQVFPPTPLEDVYICPPMAPTNHRRLLQLYMFQTEYRQTSLLHQKGGACYCKRWDTQSWGLTSMSRLMCCFC